MSLYLYRKVEELRLMERRYVLQLFKHDEELRVL